MRILVLILTISVSLFALGHEAVISLSFPYGAETNGLAESGVAYSNSLLSTFQNPANASFYGQCNEVDFTFAGGYMNLLPSLHLSGMFTSHGTVGLFFPELFNDFGFSFSHNFFWLNFGYISSYNPDGTLGDSSLAYEHVNTSTFSFNWKEYLAMGFSIKPFYSQLSDTSTTQGVVFDIGFRGQYTFTIQEDYFITPGLGYSITNFGKSRVTYQNDTAGIDPDSLDYDPLPKNMRIGFSVEGGRKDVISGALIYDYSRPLVPDENWKMDEGIHHIGVQFRATPIIDVNQGIMIDNMGERFEYHIGASIGFRRNAMRRFLYYLNPLKTFEPARNIQALYSISTILPWGDNDVRLFQTSHEISFSISFGDYSPHEPPIE